MEKQTPGGEDKGFFEGPRGNKSESAPGHLQSPSVRRTRRDDFEIESNREERDRAYMHPSQNRDTGMGAGYASPRGQGLLYHGVSNSQRGNVAHDYSGDLNGQGMQALVPTYREHYWQERGDRYSPGGGWSRDQQTPLTRESRDKARYTPGREQETPRGLIRREEGERGQAHPRGGDPEGPRGRNPYTPMTPGSGCRPKYTSRREPETPKGYGRRELEGERGPRGRGKSVNLPQSLKVDGKSNWKAFYVKFSRYAEVSEWTEGECRQQLCWCLDGKAREYYALAVEWNQDMPYKDLISKLEKRFGLRELPETAQVQFSNARQTLEELLEDWTDRVLSLATRAFRELPKHHMYQQVVVKFCQGSADKEAGSYASNIRPQNIDEAIDKMRWHQHNHQAIYEHPPRKEVKQVSPGPYSGRPDSGAARVCVV